MYDELTVESNVRAGMIRNERVARFLKRFTNHGRDAILVEVRELCRGNDGEMYEAKYNLAIETGGEDLSSLNEGDFVTLGYYIQSYEEKPKGIPCGEYLTKLKLRGIRRLRKDKIAEAQQRIFESVRLVSFDDISKSLTAKKWQ